MNDSVSARRIVACRCPSEAGHLVCCPVQERAAILMADAHLPEDEADARASRDERVGQRALFGDTFPARPRGRGGPFRTEKHCASESVGSAAQTEDTGTKAATPGA